MINRVAGTGPVVILVVEDEPLLRELTVELIVEEGFVALEAGDAEEAMALLKVRPDIAVVFTDINMPGSLDGLELAHTVHDRWPPMGILVASGRVRLKPSNLPPNAVFLEKPYRGAALIAHLRTLADPARTLVASDLLA